MRMADSRVPGEQPPRFPSVFEGRRRFDQTMTDIDGCRQIHCRDPIAGLEIIESNDFRERRAVSFLLNPAPRHVTAPARWKQMNVIGLPFANVANAITAKNLHRER